MYNACDNKVVHLPQLVDEVDDENFDQKVDVDTFNVQIHQWSHTHTYIYGFLSS